MNDQKARKGDYLVSHWNKWPSLERLLLLKCIHSSTFKIYEYQTDACSVRNCLIKWALNQISVSSSSN